MTTHAISSHVTFADLVDYWTGEQADDAAARVEEHVFACAACADRLAEIAALGRGIADAMRGARIQTMITESTLNALSRAGARMRAYTLQDQHIVPCAVWPDDDLVVTRVRADFSGFERVSLVRSAEDGRELQRIDDIAVPDGPGEILNVIPAAHLRALPSGRLRLVLSGRRDGRDEVIGTYGLEHEHIPGA